MERGIAYGTPPSSQTSSVSNIEIKLDGQLCASRHEPRVGVYAYFLRRWNELMAGLSEERLTFGNSVTKIRDHCVRSRRGIERAGISLLHGPRPSQCFQALCADMFGPCAPYAGRKTIRIQAHHSSQCVSYRITSGGAHEDKAKVENDPQTATRPLASGRLEHPGPFVLIANSESCKFGVRGSLV